MLFGPEYTAAYPLLFILVIGIIARAAVGPAESVLNMAGEQKACAFVYGLTLLVNIILTLTLIPLLGLFGAALATAVAMIFEAIALYAMVLRRLDLTMFAFAARPKVSPATQPELG